MSQINNSSHSSNDIQAALFADCLANIKEIFQLIDEVFPVDSCRYYQILPLKLEANNLTLGMIQPDNQESLKFVNSIAKVFKYNLKIELINSQTIEIILASYSQTQQPQKSELNCHKTVIDTNLNPNNNNRARKLVDSTPTIVSQPEPDILQALPDLPPDLDFFKDINLASKPSTKPPQSKKDSAATLYEIPPGFLKPNTSDGDDNPTIIADDPASFLARETAQSEPEVAFDAIQTTETIAETNKPTKTAEETKDFLPKLNFQLSWQNLLEQVIEYQSERINITRDRDCGKVAVYQNGSLQSHIDRVPLPIFCSLIDEIKTMARLPQNTSSHPKKVVIEKFHGQERILLRLEFVFREPKVNSTPPSNDKNTPTATNPTLLSSGEIGSSSCIQVKIQILRDLAIQIYEQQQMDKTSEQALQLAKQLERTLKKIQTCFHSANLTNLRELQAVQRRINHHLSLLDK